MTHEELIQEIQAMAGAELHASTWCTAELQFIHALVEAAFERGYRAAQDARRRT